MIKVNNITRKYGDFTAVDDVSFEISSGEIVGLLGHNGAGKTTIMKMLTGYLEPTAGTISIDGLPLVGNRRKIQRNIGYLPENCPVYPEMTVVDYLDYSAALHGIGEKERRELILEAIGQTALLDKGTQTIGTLSRGYRQRTGVAQAILHKPGILILDEPTNGLDPTQIQHMRDLIKELAGSTTIIISTHILQEVQAICDRVIIMRDGLKALDENLDKLQAKGRLLLSVRADEGTMRSALASLGAVAAVDVLSSAENLVDGTRFAVSLQPTTNRPEAAAQVAAAVHAQGGALYGMEFESRNLETVFAAISTQRSEGATQ